MRSPPAVEWLDDYFKWVERPYYLALLSAAAVYGSQPQASQGGAGKTDAPRRDVQVGWHRVRRGTLVHKLRLAPPVSIPMYKSLHRI
jgi:hypothetical protein